MLEGLELRHLEALRAVVERGTFARAAEALGYTQSAVSQQIAALERIVGETLFERQRGPRPVTLTAAGRLLLTHAEAILDRVGTVERDLAAFKSGETGRIEVGVFQSVGVKVLPAVVKRLRAMAPTAGPGSPVADVRPFEAHDDAVLAARVASGELDVAFQTGAADTSGLIETPLGTDSYVLLVPTDAPVGDVVCLTDLAGAPLIGQGEADSCQMRVDRAFASHGLAVDYVFRTADNGTVQSMVRAGMGYAVVPWLAVDLHDTGVRAGRPEPPIPERRLSLATGPNPSPLTRRFVQAAVAVCSEELAGQRR